MNIIKVEVDSKPLSCHLCRFRVQKDPVDISSSTANFLKDIMPANEKQQCLLTGIGPGERTYVNIEEMHKYCPLVLTSSK